MLNDEHTHIHVHYPNDDRLDRIEYALDRISRRLMQLTQKIVHLTHTGETQMADLNQELADLQSEVEANTTVTGSVTALVQRLADQIESAGNDEAQLQAIVDQLRNNNVELGNSVEKNTPADTSGGGTGEPPFPDEGTDTGNTGTGDITPEGGGGTPPDQTQPEEAPPESGFGPQAQRR